MLAMSSAIEPWRRHVEGRAHLAEVPAVGSEVHRGREHRRTGAQRERRGAGGQRRALTEELDLDASPTDVAIAQEAQHAVGLHRLDRG